MTNRTAGTAEEAVPADRASVDGDLDAVQRARLLCDRALDLLYRDQRAGTRPEDDEVVYAVEAIRTELARLEH